VCLRGRELLTVERCGAQDEKTLCWRTAPMWDSEASTTREFGAEATG